MKKDKWKFAIGTTSRVPGTGGRLHYLMVDWDTDDIPGQWDGYLPGELHWMLFQKTNHGWHLYTDYMGTFTQIITLARSLGADPSWIRIGCDRGYLFLADKDEIDFPYPVEHMVIHRGKEETA